MYQPSIEQVKVLAKTSNLIPIYREIVADLETPVSAYLKIAKGPYSFLLESVEGSERIARYSFIGTEPRRVVRTGIEKPVKDATGRIVDLEFVDPLRSIQEEMAGFKIAHVDGLPRFNGGAVGYMSYEAAGYFEKLPTPKGDGLGLPESVFMFTDTLVVFDHRKHKIQVVSHMRTHGDLDLAYREASAKIELIIARLREPLSLSAAATASPATNGVCSNMKPEDHARMVAKAKEHILAGDIIQAVVSQRFMRRTAVPPFDLYRAIRTVNPSPYMFFLDLGNFHLVGASPELLVRVEGRAVMTNPIAGTRRRGATSEEDDALDAELRHDIKERAEHIMLVDLGRNDIGRVSRPGTVKVDRLMDVERFSHVMHLVSEVSGQLKPEMSCYDALRACFPAGTVSGAPKIRAMEIIADLEPEKRGPYAGAVGYFDYSGNMDTCIAIRTMVVKDGVAYIQAGGGIVHDSQPVSEFKETQDKAGGQIKAILEAESMEQHVGQMLQKERA